MKKLLVILIVAMVGLFFNANAGVRFITDSPQHTIRDKVDSGFGGVNNSQSQCYSDGYEKTSCKSGDVAVRRCPYDSTYFAACCPQGHVYSKSYCTSRGMVPSRTSCEGLYACEQPKY